MFKLNAEQSSIVHKCNEMSYCFLCITSQEPILLIAVLQHRIQPKLNVLFSFRIIDFVSSKNASQKGQWQEFWRTPERQSTRGRFLSY